MSDTDEPVVRPFADVLREAFLGVVASIGERTDAPLFRGVSP